MKTSHYSLIKNVHQAALEICSALFLVLLVLDQWLPGFAQFSINLDYFGLFVLFLALIHILFYFQKQEN